MKKSITYYMLFFFSFIRLVPNIQKRIKSDKRISFLQNNKPHFKENSFFSYEIYRSVEKEKEINSTK